jgi:hypothetical protein
VSVGVGVTLAEEMGVETGVAGSGLGVGALVVEPESADPSDWVGDVVDVGSTPESISDAVGPPTSSGDDPSPQAAIATRATATRKDMATAHVPIVLWK